VVVGKVGIFENNSYFLASGMRRVNEGAKFFFDIRPIAAEDLADVHHDVEFLAAILEGLVDLSQLDSGGMAAVGNPMVVLARMVLPRRRCAQCFRA